jgi:hypothetical protein
MTYWCKPHLDNMGWVNIFEFTGKIYNYKSGVTKLEAKRKCWKQEPEKVENLLTL